MTRARTATQAAVTQNEGPTAARHHGPQTIASVGVSVCTIARIPTFASSMTPTSKGRKSPIIAAGKTSALSLPRARPDDSATARPTDAIAPVACTMARVATVASLMMPSSEGAKS